MVVGTPQTRERDGSWQTLNQKEMLVSKPQSIWADVGEQTPDSIGLSKPRTYKATSMSKLQNPKDMLASNHVGAQAVNPKPK